MFHIEGVDLTHVEGKHSAVVSGRSPLSARVDGGGKG
jgi:hypothetical protein